MFLFTILLIAMILISVTAVFVLGAGTAIGTIVFADLIVCIALIVLLMRHLLKKK